MSQDSEIRELIDSLNGIRAELHELRGLVAINTELNKNLTELVYTLQQGKALAPHTEQVEQVSSEPSSTAPPTVLQRPPDSIRAFLELRGVQVKGCQYHSGQPRHYPLGEIARILGENYGVLAPLLTQLKSKTASGEMFSLSLKEQDLKHVTFVCSIANRFNTVGLLSHYQYHKSPKYIIDAAPARTPEAIGFINGQWLEQYLAIKFNQLALQSKVEFSFMQGVQVVFPGDEAHEIDFLAEVNGHYLWVECKTGDYRQCLNSYMRMQRLLWLPQHQARLVLADARLSDKAKRLELEKAVSMKICSISEMAEALGQFITSCQVAQ